ncbi:hypothetical protein BD309DRAFT_958960 [Dichomitus squalens]|nr:hypothetical protein BD309DRAFT_958960 [Dichomitus squalens]
MRDLHISRGEEAALGSPPSNRRMLGRREQQKVGVAALVVDGEKLLAGRQILAAAQQGRSRTCRCQRRARGAARRRWVGGLSSCCGLQAGFGVRCSRQPGKEGGDIHVRSR